MAHRAAARVDAVGETARSAAARRGRAVGLALALAACSAPPATTAEVPAEGLGPVWSRREPAGRYRPPPYARLEAIVQREVMVGTGSWALPGTLTLPRGGRASPALVLVHGSGPNDRDESVGPNKPFCDLALGLASRGIAVLRYEKVTRQHGEALERALGDALTLERESVDDALAAVALLRATPEVDPTRIFVLGHSAGGSAIPRIARRDEAVRGFIILAGATRPLEDVLHGQMRYIAALDGAISPEEQQILDAIERQGRRVKALDAAGRGGDPDKHRLPLGIAAPYWRDLKAHPPTRLIASERRPVLVLHGDRDYQVTLEDFEGWRRALAASPAATFKRYPQLDHLFIAGQGPSTPSDYLRPGHVARAVVDDIAAWIAAH